MAGYEGSRQIFGIFNVSSFVWDYGLRLTISRLGACLSLGPVEVQVHVQESIGK